jgi:predicted glutamine amidotransferase
MCMLCVIPPNTIPSRDKLENSALNNPHGFGFAIVVPEEGRIICERTMSADESINRFLELRNRYMTGYAVWHARIATSGKIDLSNCHPFLVPDKEHPLATYVAHNGMLDVHEEVGDTRSDTRIFAEDLLPAIGGVTALDNPQVFNLIDEFTRGSKVAILTLHPKAEYQLYMFHENAGNWDKETGVWWSNSSCELTSYAKYNGYYDYDPAYVGATKDDKYDKEYLQWLKQTDPMYNMVVCQGCWHEFDWTDVPDDRCPKCKYCLMCDGSEQSCMCYRPTEAHRHYEAKKQITSKNTPEGGWIVS